MAEALITAVTIYITMVINYLFVKNNIHYRFKEDQKEVRISAYKTPDF